MSKEYEILEAMYDAFYGNTNYQDEIDKTKAGIDNAYIDSGSGVYEPFIKFTNKDGTMYKVSIEKIESRIVSCGYNADTKVATYYDKDGRVVYEISDVADRDHADKMIDDLNYEMV